jgi:LysR family transcriptional regulator, glycine cleavage system transcriptional activator
VEFEHFYLAIQAAEAGQGMAIASIHMVAAALAEGRLCAPFGFGTDTTSYLALRPSGSSDARVDLLIEWLGQIMMENVNLEENFIG